MLKGLIQRFEPKCFEAKCFEHIRFEYSRLEHSRFKPNRFELKRFKQRCGFTASLLSCTVIALTAATPAQALTIVRNFIGGNPAPQTAGGGNLIDIFNAAADYWEAAIQDDYQLTLNYAWAARSGNILATYSPQRSNPSAPFRNREGLIRFDNDSTFKWFADPTPRESSEYLDFSTASRDLSNGNPGVSDINVERRWVSPSGAAVGRYDLFNVALHEIGHGLNILSSNRGFAQETALDGDIDLTGTSPFAGSSIPTTPIGGGHLNLHEAVMYPFISSGQRRLLTEADILASAQVSGFTDLDLNPQLGGNPPNQAVPEGDLGLALLLGAGLLGARRKLRQPQHSSGIGLTT